MEIKFSITENIKPRKTETGFHSAPKTYIHFYKQKFLCSPCSHYCFLQGIKLALDVLQLGTLTHYFQRDGQSSKKFIIGGLH